MAIVRDYNQAMRLRVLFVVAAVLIGLPRVADAIDLAKEIGPQKWIERLVPEDLPPLEYPSYFNDLDKAKMQVARGRYRLALVTLVKARNVDAPEAAIVKATALSTLGR